MRENKTHLMKKFIVFSVALFVFILTVGSAVFIFSMQNIIKGNKGNELLQMLEIQRIKLENSINSEIALVLKLADSPLIKRHFADPSNPEIEKYVLEEISGYRRAFSSFSIFWINDIDKIFYSDDNASYRVNPADPSNYWYNMTLYETKVYNFNINYNPDINTTKLWINAPVFADNHKSLGMVGTGIELSKYIDMIYQSVDDKVELYLFNEAGEITGAKDVEAVFMKKKIAEELSGANINILAESKNLQPGETRTFDTSYGKIVIGTIPVLGWYIIAIAPINITDYDPTMVALFSVMLTVIALILVIFNMIVAGFLKSLKKTMDSLKAASKAKSEFLATMSHEIRTPLNAIIGIAQIQLQKNGLAKEYSEEMEKIYTSGANLLGIINDILDMSKIEIGKLELHPVQYNTADLINDAVQLNIVRIGSKPIEFILGIDETLPSTLCGDVLRLKQILNNLLSNAIKYTEKGYVKLSVSHSTENEKTIIRFSIEDTGQGIKPGDVKKLFLEYSRFNAEANSSIEGTGLGLSITKRLVEMMEGTIEVQSEYGKGSIFVVTVKQQNAACAPLGAELARKLRDFTFISERQVDKLQTPRVPMAYGKVLVVDDVAANLYVAAGLLAPYKLSVEMAESGFAALEKIAGGEVYDIIFMDHMMPLMDGIETTQKLRAEGYTGVIVALTANALAGNDKMFVQNGFDGFISKPIDVWKLDELLNKFVRDRHPQEALKYQTETVAEKMATEMLAADPKFIKIFCRDAAKAIITLRETAANKDWKLFATTAHAMKPALVSLGEREASEAAAALEEAGKGGDAAFIAANTESFIKILEELIQRYTLAETENEDAEEDIPYLIEQLQTLKTACENYDDTAAYAALDKLKEKRWKTEISATLEQIRDMLFLHSDFDAAAECAGTVLLQKTRGHLL